MEELEALTILTGIPLLGSIKIRLLIDHFGTVTDALYASAEEIESLPGFGPKIVKGWKEYLAGDKWKKNLSLVERFDAQLISYKDARYPKRLLDIIDFPILLYVKGEVLPKDHRSLALIGTRQATNYGLEMAHQLGRELAQSDFTIVSGLARGVDTAAHRGGLEGGRTIAVLGSGLCQLYPPENRELAEKIVENGALISEFPMDAPPDRTHFPQRNRIVSGMTLGTVLIEAPLQSGAMLTVDKAIQQKKEVFVLPGRADQETFRGNHHLIKEKKGRLIENSGDIVRCYDQTDLPLIFKTARQPGVALEKEEQDFLHLLPYEELSIDEISKRFPWPIKKLSILLMSLVLKKMIKEYPGKIYKKV